MPDPKRPIIDYAGPRRRPFSWYYPVWVGIVTTLLIAVMSVAAYGFGLTDGPTYSRMFRIVHGLIGGGWLLNTVFLFAGMRAPESVVMLILWFTCFFVSGYCTLVYLGIAVTGH